MNILITGGDGYIGSIITEYLHKKKNDLWIIDLKRNSDIFKLTKEDFFHIDYIIHLAAIVGNEACDEDPELAYHTNVKGLLRIKHYCGNIPIIFASTCSIYGPESIYSDTKKQAELLLGPNDTILRFGTAFGWSPSMRYNLVINKLVQMAKEKGKIIIYGGEQWRPFIHVKDIARIIYKCIKHHIVGTHDLAIENVMMMTLGRRIQACFPGTQIEIQNHNLDNRSYKASCPFECKYTLEYGFRELWEHIKVKEMII